MTIKERCREALTGMYLTNAGLSEEQIQKLRDVGYFEAPAARKHHLAEPGGLAIHSTNVTYWLLKLSETMEVRWPRPESPYLVGMLHDLVKCFCYRPITGAGQDKVEYKKVDTKYAGHGLASCMFARDLGIELQPIEFRSIEYHMGAFGLSAEELKAYDAVLNYKDSTLNLYATHTADMIASHVDEVYNLDEAENA